MLAIEIISAVLMFFITIAVMTLAGAVSNIAKALQAKVVQGSMTGREWDDFLDLYNRKRGQK